jgi:MFS family permease
MPITMSAWTATGADPAMLQSGVSYNNILADGGTHLSWLGDVFALPHQLPFAAALSIGDFLVILGATGFVYQACTPRMTGARTNLLDPLRIPAFRRIIIGRFVSGVGDWITQVALVTWIYVGTRSTLLVSVFLLGRILSAMAGGVMSAPLLDRLSGFRTLGIVEVLRSGLTLAMIPLAITGYVWPVIALSTLSAFLSAATNPSASGLVPTLLPKSQLQAGNALHNLAPSLTSIVGAALAALVVIHFGIGWALSLDVATFMVAALTYRSFASETKPPGPPKLNPVTRRELLAAISHNRTLVGVSLAFVCSTAAFGLLNATSAALFDDHFHHADAYGYVAAMIGLGYLAGETLTAHVRRPIVVRRSISVALSITAAAAILIADAPTIATAFLGMFVLGAADGVTEVTHDTLIQTSAPPSNLSGTFALIGSIERVGMIAGIIAAPLLIDATSPATVVRLGGALLICGALTAALCLSTQPTKRSVRHACPPATTNLDVHLN